MSKADYSSEDVETLKEKNRTLASSLKRAADELAKAKAQLTQVSQPPLTFATMLRVDRVTTDEHGIQHALAEVATQGRRLIVPVAPGVSASRLKAGRTVVLNEHMVLLEQRDVETVGQIRIVKQVFADGRLLVADASGDAQVVRRSESMAGTSVSGTDRVLVSMAGDLALALVPHEDDSNLVLEQTPDVTFEDIGGLDAQIERIIDAVELPYRHRELFNRYALDAPKGILLYGPPGNGKTLIAKAVAHALADGGQTPGVFLSVKGPELLNKFVGESERLIRLIFKRARECATSGRPVIVFIDEMDSLLRARGSGVSSDVETTIVPQFLAELDGIERLDNVMVIGASNRIDMIDPAVLRPGRLDVKIRVERPGSRQARQILKHYITGELPLSGQVSAKELIDAVVDDIYRQDGSRHLCDVQDGQGRWSQLYFDDVISGAMLKNIVDRAKTEAVKASIRTGVDVALERDMFLSAVQEEFEESEETLVDADPVQFSHINAPRTGSIVAMRPATQPQAHPSLSDSSLVDEPWTEYRH